MEDVFDMKIIKRSGSEATFDVDKISAAIRKANESVIDYEKYTCNMQKHKSRRIHDTEFSCLYFIVE